MNKRMSSGVRTPDAPPQPRIWAFTMDGYLPPGDTANPDARPTAADVAFDHLLARLDGLRQRLVANLPYAPDRTRHNKDKHGRSA